MEYHNNYYYACPKLCFVCCLPDSAFSEWEGREFLHSFPGQNQRKTENANTNFGVGMILVGTAGVTLQQTNNYSCSALQFPKIPRVALDGRSFRIVSRVKGKQKKSRNIPFGVIFWRSRKAEDSNNKLQICMIK
jgi:hypothetical protein